MSERASYVERVRRLADGKEDEEDRRWLRGCLYAYLVCARHGLTLDAALGLSTDPGRLSWWRLESLRERDDAIRALAARICGDRPPPVAEQAVRVVELLRRYQASAWRSDRQSTAPPRHYCETKQLLWRICRADDAELSPRQVRRIISSE